MNDDYDDPIDGERFRPLLGSAMNGADESSWEPDDEDHPEPLTGETAGRVKLPYDFIGDGTVPNRPSPDGEDFGRELARMFAAPLERIIAACPDAQRPCVECAFVAGTVPNRCLATVANALKCVIEREPFDCHMADRRCAGWVAAVADSMTLEAMRNDPQSASREVSGATS